MLRRRIVSSGLPTIQEAWIDSGLAKWVNESTKNSVRFNTELTGDLVVPKVKDRYRITNMLSMFGNCTSLTSLDLSNLNTSNVTNMSSMFSSCTSLKTIYMRNCSEDTINKIKTQLSTGGITGVDIITS